VKTCPRAEARSLAGADGASLITRRRARWLHGRRPARGRSAWRAGAARDGRRHSSACCVGVSNHDHPSSAISRARCTGVLAPVALALVRALRRHDPSLARAAARGPPAVAYIAVFGADGGVNDVIVADRAAARGAAPHRAGRLADREGAPAAYCSPAAPIHQFPLLPQALRGVIAPTPPATTSHGPPGRPRAATRVSTRRSNLSCSPAPFRATAFPPRRSGLSRLRRSLARFVAERNATLETRR